MVHDRFCVHIFQLAYFTVRLTHFTSVVANTRYMSFDILDRLVSPVEDRLCFFRSVYRLGLGNVIQ